MKLLNLASGSLIGCSSYTGGWDYRKYELTRCVLFHSIHFFFLKKKKISFL